MSIKEDLKVAKYLFYVTLVRLFPLNARITFALLALPPLDSSSLNLF